MHAIARPKETRRANRRPITVRADLREAGSARFAVEVRDLSETGFCCESWDSIALGKTVFLHLDSFAPFAATVMWRDGTLLGFEFARPLHSAVVDTIAQRFVTVPAGQAATRQG